MQEKLILFLFLAPPLVTTLRRTDSDRSSKLLLTENRFLEGHAIQRQRAYDVMACAQLCLAETHCDSFNFENIENGMCEMTSKGGFGDSAGLENLFHRQGYVFGQQIPVRANSYSTRPGPTRFEFTNLNGAGQTGPTSAAGYNGTSLAGAVEVDKNGIQFWTVPYTGNYVIEAFGASGANGTCATKKIPNPGCDPGWNLGGRGARIQGTFALSANTRLKILVGQQALLLNGLSNEIHGGGGGGTFVTLIDNKPLVVAGGGGGGGITKKGFGNGDPGLASRNGSRHGGWEGSGGKLYNTESGIVGIGAEVAAGTGAGLLEDGIGYQGLFQGAKSFVNGGMGGDGPSLKGGFGGGGVGLQAPGGGGGYSGGGVEGSKVSGMAGGGGSFNTGLLQSNTPGANKGDGKVVIIFKT